MTDNTEVTTEDGVAYADMPWQKLKALMTAEGQAWVNAEHAIKYLTDLDNADAPPVDDGPTDDIDPEDDVVEGDDLITEPECEETGPCFDPNEPYGTVSSENSRAKYWQNGHYFDNFHNVVPAEDV